MKITLAFLLLSLTYCSHLRSLASTPDYNSFVLAVQWPSGLCASETSICKEKLAKMKKNTMSIHGLWPSLKSGKMLPQCNSGTTIDVENDGSAIFEQMETVWPSFMKTDENFWTHEYNKHGYCYVNENNLSGYKDYFEHTINFFYEYGFEDMIKKAYGDRSGEAVQTTLSELQEKIELYYPGSVFKAICKGSKNKTYLTEMYFYFDLNFKPTNKVKFSGGCSKTKKFYINFK